MLNYIVLCIEVKVDANKLIGAVLSWQVVWVFANRIEKVFTWNREWGKAGEVGHNIFPDINVDFICSYFQ